MSGSRPRLSLTEAVAAGLILLLAAPLFLWPSYRQAASAGAWAVTRPLLRGNLWAKPDPRAARELSALGRQMEFRIRSYPVTPAAAEAWFKEWPVSPPTRQLFLRLLLRQLPEIACKESSPSQRLDLTDTLLAFSAEGRKGQPDNGFYWFAEALVLFYSGKDDAALLALKESQRCSVFDPGLRGLNRSELALWRTETPPWILLPPAPRAWGLDLERPIHAFSRGLAIQQRAMLKKYNLERAMDVTFAHLALARQLLDNGWTPADFAIAQGVQRRALEPFWQDGQKDPTLAQLQENFLALLDDQGDSQAVSKHRSWFDRSARAEKAVLAHLRSWRQAQALATWNASSVLGSLMLQTTSLLLLWITLLFFPAGPGGAPAAHRAFTLPTLGFAAVPLAWALTGWPAGGTLLFLGLGLGWLVWAALLRAGAGPFHVPAVRAAAAQGTVAMCAATWLALATGALLRAYQQQQAARLFTQGWLE